MIARGNELTGAVFSDCERYRYRLWRRWDQSRASLVWVMLNPSTADESVLDPTVTRCVKRAKRWDFGGCEVVNIFALRSTDPAGLLAVDDPVGGLKNDLYILEAAEQAGRIVVAWGQPKWPIVVERARFVAAMLERRGFELSALACTTAGWPRHPLYLKNDLVPMKWAAP